MFAAEAPARVIGVLDWEMATIGDPLADLGYLLAFWRQKGDPPPALSAENNWRVTEEDGFPTRDELAQHYAQRAQISFSADTMRFYHALAIWKMAILLEGSYKRMRAGFTDDPFFEELENGVPALAQNARAVIGG